MQVAASFGPTDNDLSRQQNDAGISREAPMLNPECGRLHPRRMLPPSQESHRPDGTATRYSALLAFGGEEARSEVHT